MIKVLNWLTKAPMYRLLIGAVILFVIIAMAEGQAYWIGGAAAIVYLFLLTYSYFAKNE